MKSTQNSPSYLADTYALIEIFVGNPNYERYLDRQLVTTKFHLAELHYYFLREYGERNATASLSFWAPRSVSVSFTAVRKAMLFRFVHRKEKLSYQDCIGQAVANELGMPFLTGDAKFKDKANVEFVV